jgi:branched-chain amino acid transport system substrate-binding protein
MNVAEHRAPQRTRTAAALLCFAVVCLSAAAARAEAAIKIAVIGEESSVTGASITKAAALAAEDINAHGGVNGGRVEIVTYDDHSSAADAVGMFQRAVNQDKVAAVIASYINDVALAIAPWSARLNMPFITPGATSTEISKQIHSDYEHYKYVFHGWLTSAFIAQSICDFAHDLLVGQFNMKTAVILSEDAAWTASLDAQYLSCLPKAGLQVLDHVRFNPDTRDFTAIFNQIASQHPDVIITGIRHVGVRPTVQWHEARVPIPMAGQSWQATTSTFWKDTNGAAEGMLTATAAAPGVALTPSTVPFTELYTKRYGVPPAYDGYSTYDMVHIVAAAAARAGTTEPDKMVVALEETDHVGTIGREQFYGREQESTHALKYGPGLVTGVNIQWQDGRQICVWPAANATAKIAFPPFVKLPKQASGP